MSQGDLKLENRLIDHLHDVVYEDLSPEVVTCCKRLIMDTVGVSFPGSQAPGVAELVSLMASWRSQEGASVFFQNFKVAAPMAAMANSTMMHALDFDDTLDASALHAFVTVLPAALAAVESCGKIINGRSLITALVLGADTVCRISLGIRRPLSWIRTATCGSFGAAAVVGKILNLNREQLSDALGIVYAQTAGNAQGLLEGRLVKRMQPAFAAAAGVTAAFLADKGISGSRGFLSGDYGYYQLYEHGDVDLPAVLKDLGRRFAVVDLSIKPYPCCRMTHAAIDAALAVRNRVGETESIDRIDVQTSSMVTEMVGKPFQLGRNPQVDAQFSIPYTVACALERGDVFLADFEPQAIADPEVLSLAKKVKVIADPALPAKNILSARLWIHKNGNQPVESVISAPLGNPVRPMSADQCREKFGKCLDYSKLTNMGPKRQQILATIENIENLSDVRELIGQLTA